MSGQGASKSIGKGKERAAIVLDDEEDDYGQDGDYLEGATEEEREQVASVSTTELPTVCESSQNIIMEG